MATDDRVALCVARFYEELAERLVAGAQGALSEAGITDVDSFDVPGAFELPVIAKYAAESGRYVAVVCLGAVIRGETDHYDWVCAETARGIQQVQLETGVPCGFGVLTVDTMEQALARVSGGAKRDTGRHAVEAALASLAVKRELQRGRRGADGLHALASAAGPHAASRPGGCIAAGGVGACAGPHARPAAHAPSGTRTLGAVGAIEASLALARRPDLSPSRRICVLRCAGPAHRPRPSASSPSGPRRRTGDDHGGRRA